MTENDLDANKGTDTGNLNLASTNRTALSLIEALFSDDENFEPDEIEKLLSATTDLLGDNFLVKNGLRAGLLWLETRGLLATGKRFSEISIEARVRFLKKYESGAVSGKLLSALSLPFKSTYLLANDGATSGHTSARINVTNDTAANNEDTERWRAQVSSATDFTEDQELEADVVIVGTGAGGAAAACELAGRGLAVVLIEEGEYFTRKDFTGNLPEMAKKLYRAMGATIAWGNTQIPIPIGRSVGGTTTINSGTCLRTPDLTLKSWVDEGLGDFSSEQLKPYFDLVEEVLQVEKAEAKYVGEIGNIIKAGAQALGLKKFSVLRRNAPGCDGQGVCQFGCPSNAKQSTNVSFIPRALQSGAFLFTQFRVGKLIKSGNKATGLIAYGQSSEGKKIKLSVKAERVIIAMGTLLTPQFLAAQGVKNKNLGNHLSIHPAGGMSGHFPDKNFDNANTIPQGYGVSDLADEGILFEGATLPLVAHGLLGNFKQEEFIKRKASYQQTAYFGFMIKDSSRGKVGKGISKDIPLIRYHMNDADFALFVKAMSTLGKILFRAGAESVHMMGYDRVFNITSEAELDRILSRNLKPRHFFISAYHPLGTARIAESEEKGVCDSEHRVFGMKGLYVMDGSNVPSSLGANPQVTIMALATRAARIMADQIQSEQEDIQLAKTA